MTLEQILDEAMRLPAEQRAIVADRLLGTLGKDEDFEISPAWREEITRRIAAIDAGEMQTLDADAVFERMRRMLHS